MRSKLDVLRKEYLNLLKKHNIKEEDVKSSFRERFELIKKRSFSKDPELIFSANIWKDLIKDYPVLNSDLSIEDKVELISKNLVENPPLYGHSIFIQNLIKGYGLELKEEIYFDIFPTNEFNASAHLTKNGSIILLNKGIIKLIHNIIYSSFYLISNQYLSATDKHEFEKKITLHTITIIINYLLHTQHRSIFVNNYELDKESFFSAFYLIAAVKNFIVAHEVAHVLLEHKSKNNLRPILSDSGEEVHVVNRSHIQEFEADNLAQKLLIYSDQNNFPIPSIGGGLGFLLIYLMVLNIESKLSSNPRMYRSASDSHPSAIERIKKLDELIQQYDYEPIQEGLTNCTVLQKQLLFIEKTKIEFDFSGKIRISM